MTYISCLYSNVRALDLPHYDFQAAIYMLIITVTILLLGVSSTVFAEKYMKCPVCYEPKRNLNCLTAKLASEYCFSLAYKKLLIFIGFVSYKLLLLFYEALLLK